MDKKNKNIQQPLKSTSKIATYAVIMLLMVILVIIIAAIADNREQHIEDSYKSQLDNSTQMNLNIQSQITSLSNENYELKNNLKSAEDKALLYESVNDVCTTLSEVNNLINDNKKEDAQVKFDSIDKENLPEAVITYYNMTADKLKNK